MSRFTLCLLPVMLLTAVPGAIAADAGLPFPAQGPAVIEAPPPPPVVVERPITGPLAPPPRIRYGCERVWRCDATVCEWRRGCWGVYGYVEGPYYTSTFARRQWEAHGHPVPRGPR